MSKISKNIFEKSHAVITMIFSLLKIMRVSLTRSLSIPILVIVAAAEDVFKSIGSQVPKFALPGWQRSSAGVVALTFAGKFIFAK